MNKLALLLLTTWVISSCDSERGTALEEPVVEGAARGPNGGRVLVAGDFGIELAIFETGVPPEFHAWVTAAGAPVPPHDVALAVELGRLGGDVDRIEFTAQDDFLRSTSVVREPHSFDVTVVARHAGREHRFAYASYEGRTEIAADVARAAGIATATAGPGTINDELLLYGTVTPDVARVRKVRARFPGVIRSVSRDVGAAVRAGDTLATIESNESLQDYVVITPIAGVVTARHAAAGDQADADALFEIADFSSVWAELDVFSRDRPRLAIGQAVSITAEAGLEEAGVISYLAPVGSRASQSLIARVVLDNADGRWTPGQFVEGRVTIDTALVPLAVPLAALQRFRDFDVVFAEVGTTYEVRMLTLGRRDGGFVEVLSGLAPGTVYVTANSYLIKADIEKAGASHDH